MKNIFIIFCNPKENSLSESIAKTYLESSNKGNNHVELCNVYDLSLNFFSFENSLSTELKNFQDKLFKADVVVFIYPVWCLGIPAKLKCLIENTFQLNGEPAKQLKGKSAVVIQTYGMPEFVMKYFIGDLSYKFMHSLLRFCGIKVIKRFDYGLVGKADNSKINLFLEKISKFAAK